MQLSIKIQRSEGSDLREVDRMKTSAYKADEGHDAPWCQVHIETQRWTKHWWYMSCEHIAKYHHQSS